jgi:hypothetical protein
VPALREFEPANDYIFARQASGGNGREDEMSTAIIALVVLAAIWTIVLWGSRYFGPR